MKLIVSMVMCLMAVTTSRCMPVAENAPEPESSPAAATAENAASLLVVPLEKTALPVLDAAELGTKLPSSITEESHRAAVPANARSSEPETLPTVIKDKEAEVVSAEWAKKLDEKTPQTETIRASAEPATSVPEIKAIPQGKSSEEHATETSMSNEKLGIASGKSSEAAKEETIASENESSGKSAPTEESREKSPLSDSSSEQKQRVIEADVAESIAEAKIDEIKKEAEPAIEKTDRVTREAEEAAAAAAAAKASVSPALPVSLAEPIPAAAPEVEASLAEVGKPSSAGVATAIEGKSAPIDNAGIEQDRVNVGATENVEKEIEKKNVAEVKEPIVQAVERTSGHLENEPTEIGAAAVAAKIPQAKRETVDTTVAEQNVGNVALAADNVESKPETVASKSSVQATKEIKERSEESSASDNVTTSDEKKEGSSSSSSIVAAKSSISADNDEQLAKAIVPEESKAEELPKPQEVTAIKESSEKREIPTKQESSESTESDEAASSKRIEHSE